MTSSHNAKSCICQRPWSSLTSGELAMRPAQLIKTSIGPWRRRRSSMAAVAAAPSARSQVVAITRSLDPARGGALSTARTSQPADAKCSTRCEPISPELPVMSTERVGRSDANAPRGQDVPYRALASQRCDFDGRQLDAEPRLDADDQLHVLQRVPSGALRENGLVVDR